MTLGKILLHPRSIALVGASDDPTKTTARPMQFLRANGFAGEIFPVNAARPTVLGEKAWASLAELPHRPDHAFVLAASGAIEGIVEQCVTLGIPLVTILAGGFGEEGEAGRAREAALKASLAGSGTRLLGPNSIGIVNVGNGMTLTANAAFSETDIPQGDVFVASHSGSVIGAILSRGKERGVGFAGFVSMGAELDLSMGEVCEALCDDPSIGRFALFLETIYNGPALKRFAVAAARHGKPVIVYKLGRSAQGAELSQTHTGAIAGEDAIADAFLRDCGFARVDTFDGLIEGVAALDRFRPPSAGAAPRVGVVTTTGGGAAMVVDRLGLVGIDVKAPGEAARAALTSRGIATSEARIVDLTLAGTRPEVMRAALDAMLDCGEYDGVIAVAGSSARFQPHLLIPAIAGAAGTDRPIAAFVAPAAPEALAQLSAAGVPSFRTPEACADALAAAFTRRPCKPEPAAALAGDPVLLDEAASYAAIEALGIPAARHAVIDITASTSPIGYPVAVKFVSNQVYHKTELGGVVLGVEDDAGLQAAIRSIAASVQRHDSGLAVDRLLVQAMSRGCGEALLSFTRDPDAGPMVMLAAGGTLAEILKDRSIRSAPVDLATARQMVSEIRMFEALAGYRGSAAGDLESLARAVVAISNAGPEVAEMEINPMIIRTDGAVAVDAVVRKVM